MLVEALGSAYERRDRERAMGSFLREYWIWIVAPIALGGGDDPPFIYRIS